MPIAYATRQLDDVVVREGHPLTIADQQTRFLLTFRGLLSTKGLGIRPFFKQAFREYGLPMANGTDYGVPFATDGIRGLSQLQCVVDAPRHSASTHSAVTTAAERCA